MSGRYDYEGPLGTMKENDVRMVEGISNEVVYAFLLLCLFAIPLLYWVWKQGHRALQTIHPAQQRLVEEARRRLGIGSARDTETTTTSNGSNTGTETIQPRLYNQDRVCPVCFGNARFAIQTNCGHLFCAPCLIAYWRYGNWLGPVKCPVCRTFVTVLLNCFSEADPEESGRREALADINDYNRRFSGEPRPWMDYIRDLPVLVPFLLSQLFSMSGLMWMFRVRILLCLFALLVYVLSPLDIIPEAIFGLLGILDDLFIALMVMLYVTIAYRRLLANRQD